MISSIIDMHTHALPMKIARNQEHYSRMDRILSLPFYKGSECNVEQLVRQMDEVGVEKAVILNWAFAREDITYCKELNDLLAEEVARFPDILVGFATVPPLAGEAAVEELERAVKDLELKGVKLHPGTQGFWPDSPEVFSIYEKAKELGIPVYFDTEPALRFDSRGHPGRILYGPAKAFPKLKIICAHMGGGMWLWMIQGIGSSGPNNEEVAHRIIPKIFFDTAVNDRRVGIAIETTIKLMGAKNIVFGTDWLNGSYAEKVKNLASVIENLNISDYEKRMILRDNAHKILSL